MSSEDLIIGYLDLKESDSSYIGSVLTVNCEGYPIESLMTEPLEITPEQKIYYGPTLEKYIISEILGKSLVSKLGRKPSFIIIPSSKLLVLNRVTDIPVVYLDQKTRSNYIYLGEESDAKFVNDIPRNAYQYDVLEPFDRLSAAYDYSTNR